MEFRQVAGSVFSWREWWLVLVKKDKQICADPSKVVADIDFLEDDLLSRFIISFSTSPNDTGLNLNVSGIICGQPSFV